MKKLLCYIDHMGRGGAQRVMCVLIRYFSEQGYEVVLVNDYKRDEALPHYDVPDAVKRIYLRNTIKGNPISKNMKRIAALRKAVKKEKPDLVLSFLGAPNMRMLIATIGVDVGKVVSVRNDPKREYGTGKIKRWLVNQLFRKADGVVFQTGDAKLYFDPAIGKRSRIRSETNFINMTEVHARMGL